LKTVLRFPTLSSQSAAMVKYMKECRPLAANRLTKHASLRNRLKS
jgi:hypothetical protein